MATVTTPQRPTTTARARIGGLDGLRAIAVVGVLLYHADVPWMRGGFIGVDIFFVLSGYLVTSIVLDGLEKRGGLGFRSFWGRRLRRLAPAELTMLIVITVSMAVAFRDELSTLRGQVIAALTGTTNWYLIATEGSYFEQVGRPPVFRHLWSLAIELQFYLFWPLILVALYKRFDDRVHLVVIGLVVAILASAIYMAFLFDPDADPTRAYFDTFARLSAPLCGALLAILWRPRALLRGPARDHGARFSALGIAALLGLVWMLHVSGDRSAFMYRGGFLLAAILSAVVVAGITHPGGALGGRHGLGAPWLVAIGLRSYGLYLWHWPIYTLLRPRIDVGWSWGTTFAVRIILTIGLTELCYRLVERPWHTRAPSASFPVIRDRLLHPKSVPPVPRFLTLGAAAMSVIAVTVWLVPHPVHDEIGDSLRAGEAALGGPTGTIPGGGTTPIVTTTTRPGDTTAPVDPNASTTTFPKPVANGPVTIVGDSVMVGAAPDVRGVFGDRAYIDAKVSRQAAAIAPILQSLATANQLAPTVVVQVGINGTVTRKNLEDMAEAVAGRRLLVINARVPRSWEAGNNALVKSLVPTLPNADYIDWYKESNGHLDWFLDDGVHLTEQGRQAYANLIKRSVDDT